MKTVLKVILTSIIIVVLGVSALVFALYFRNGHVGTETAFAQSSFLKNAPEPLTEALTVKIVTFNIQDL